MDDARALPANVGDGTVVWADFQRLGRGRGAGRRWRAAAGENLLLTLVVSRAAATGSDAVHTIGSIPLRAGLAVARTAVALGINESDLRVKWPNDVLVRGGKLCGILCEGVAGRFHIGVGLNVNQTEFESPDDGVEATPRRWRRSGPAEPVSLALLAGSRFELTAVLDVLLAELRCVLRDPRWREHANALLYRRGETVTVHPGSRASRSAPSTRQTGSATGCVLEIGIDGTLRVQLTDGSVMSVLQPHQLDYGD